MKVDFQEAIFNAISSKFTGRLIFIGPEGGVVRVVFIDGKIKEVDSTWGFGAKELEKLKVWKEGNVLTKELSEREVEKYKALPSIEYKLNCPNCGHEIPLNTNFCPECGYQVRDVKICLNCGFENPVDAKFCERCGSKFYLEQITKNVKTCPNCSSAIHQNAKFCPECGYSFLKICPRCKSENPPEARFCEECGYDFAIKRSNPIKTVVLSVILIIFVFFLSLYFLLNNNKNEIPKVLQAPNVIQEFITFSSDTNEKDIVKVETVKVEGKQPIKTFTETTSQHQTINKEKKEEPFVISKTESLLICKEENYNYDEIKIPSINFEITQKKPLLIYKYGPINLSSYDTLKVEIQTLVGLQRSRDAIVLAVNQKSIDQIENGIIYETENLDNFDNFVKSGFNLLFVKKYIAQKGNFVFNPNFPDNYYLVVINPPYIEKSDKKIYIKTRPLFFNLRITIKKCKKELSVSNFSSPTFHKFF